MGQGIILHQQMLKSQQSGQDDAPKPVKPPKTQKKRSLSLSLGSLSPMNFRRSSAVKSASARSPPVLTTVVEAQPAGEKKKEVRVQL